MENYNDELHPDELAHHGTKGMKWGRRLYQNKDGTLTPLGKKHYNKEVAKIKAETEKIKAAEKVAENKKKTQAKFDKLDAKKQELEERKKALKDGGKAKNGKDDDAPEETAAERKARILKSTDPKEVYDNRDVLTNNELQERLNRINLEAQLQSKIPVVPQKSAMDYINQSLATYRKVDEAYSTVTNSAMGKAVMKKLGLDTKDDTFDLGKFVKDIDKQSSAKIKETVERVKNTKTLTDEFNKQENKRKADEEHARQEAENKKAKEKAQKQVDEYNKQWQHGKSDDTITSQTGEYSYKKGDDRMSNGRDDVRSTQYYPAVIDSSLTSATGSKSYSTGRDYVNNNASKMKMSDVDVFEPEWYTRMKKNGQL